MTGSDYNNDIILEIYKMITNDANVMTVIFARVFV